MSCDLLIFLCLSGVCEKEQQDCELHRATTLDWQRQRQSETLNKQKLNWDKMLRRRYRGEDRATYWGSQRREKDCEECEVTGQIVRLEAAGANRLNAALTQVSKPEEMIVAAWAVSLHGYTRTVTDAPAVDSVLPLISIFIHLLLSVCFICDSISCSYYQFSSPPVGQQLFNSFICLFQRTESPNHAVASASWTHALFITFIICRLISC